MFNRASYDNSVGDGFGVLEVTGGVPVEEGQFRLFVPLRRTELTGEIAGPLASLRLVHTYCYSREQCDKTLEAVYRFPLPGDAAVTGVRVRFGDVEIGAELKEREQAEADYAAAREEGRQAALATRESPDVFTLQVAGLQPDQEVTVETSYVQLARVEGLDWRLRVPLTTAPRYTRADEAESRHAKGQPLGLLRDPGHRFALDVIVSGGAAVSSNTHQLAVSPEDGGQRVRLAEGEVLPDRDCVLTWRPVQEEVRPALRVMVHEDDPSGQLYFLALAAPPAAPQPGEGVPREVILLVDHSGSMQGAKWEAADWAVRRFLSGLTAEDSFALGLFHNTTRWFSQRPRSATAEVVAEAVRFLEQNRDSGGTELGMALEQALSLPRSEGRRARHLLIVTDAEVADSGRILRLADEEVRRDEQRRISVLCIDAAPNAFLASELAEHGGGVARFLTSAPDEEDITTSLDEVLEDWARPVLAGLSLDIERPGAQVVGREVQPGAAAGWSAVDLGDLPAGRALWVAGRVPRGDKGEINFLLRTADGHELASRRVGLAKGQAERPALKALFGARRLLTLEWLLTSGSDPAEEFTRLGYDPEQVLAGQPGTPAKLYPENALRDRQAAIRHLLVKEALDYGLACSETAFIAQRTEAGKRIEGSVAVSSALSSGWSEQFLSRSVTLRSPSRFATAMPAAAPPVGAAPPMPISRVLPAGDASATEPGIASSLRQLVSRVQRRAADAGGRASTGPESAMDADQDDAAASSAPLFSGLPAFADGAAVLFDSSTDASADRLPEEITLRRLEVRFPDGTPEPGSIASELTLLLYVGDAATPRARVRLIDLIRQGGARPLNVRRLSGQTVRLVLSDPGAAWASGVPRLEVVLHW
jgi:Ca-activated chloride channel family protein